MNGAITIQDVLGILSAIVAVGTIISGIVSGIVAAKISKYRIEQLEKKVEQYNNVKIRVQQLEDKYELLIEVMNLMREEIKDLKGAIMK